MSCAGKASAACFTTVALDKFGIFATIKMTVAKDMCRACAAGVGANVFHTS